jgi:hypothetical protein
MKLGKVVNGAGPIDSDGEEDYPIQPGMNVLMPMRMPVPGVSQFQSTPSEAWNVWGRQSVMNTMPMPNPQHFMTPNPPPGSDIHFLAAHQQAMRIAKQTYQMAVAQQAMAAAGEEWERSSTVSGMPSWRGSSVIFPGVTQSVYAGSVVGGSSTYGSGWRGSSVYGENFGPSLSRTSFASQPMPPSSFSHSTVKEGYTRQRTWSGIQEGVGPPTSWKNR